MKKAEVRHSFPYSKTYSCNSVDNVNYATLSLRLVNTGTSRDVFDLNYRQYGVNRYLWFYKFPKNKEMCRVGCVF